MKSKLMTVLSLIVVVTLAAGPVLALAPSDVAPAANNAAVETPAAKADEAAMPVKSAPATGPFVGDAVVPGSFDGDLRTLPQLPSAPGTFGQALRDEVPNRDTVRRSGVAPESSDFPSVVQREAGSGEMPAPITTFDGMTNQDNFAIFGGRVNPPDTNGAVGPNHYISSVNLVYGVYDKSGAKLFGPAKISSLFAAAPTGTACDTTDPGDPIVLYDSSADRWILSQFGFTSTAVLVPKWECVAVSKGPNPITDGWWTYAIPAPGDQFNDYPKLSVWPDAYYYTARMFPGSEPFFLSVYALERPAMLAGRPARYVRFDLPGIYDSPLATNWRGAAPPAGTPNLIALADDVTNSIITWQFRVNWDNPAASTLTPEFPVAVAPFEEACPGTRDCVPFSGAVYSPPSAATLLDDLSPRLMFNLEYRRVGSTESVWANHTITESGRTVVRWYEFRYQRSGSIITPTLYQQGTYAPTDDIWRWMASMAADKDNNMAIGWSASSPTIDPQIRYAGRLASDPLGVLAQGEVTMTIGTGHPTTTNSRWGDYSAMTVDPVDDCTFWYTQEYYTTTTGIPGDTRPWVTRIGSFKYPSCTPLAAEGTITGLVYDATTLVPLPNMPVEAFDAATNYLYAGSTDAAGIYTMTVQPGTYAVSAGPFASIGYPVKGTVSGVAVTSGNTSNANIPLNGSPFLVLGARTYADNVVGNNNNYPEPGEKQIGVTAVVTNTGVTTATSVVATLTSLTPGFTVVTPTVSYPDILAGGAQSNSTPFGITVDGALPCGTVGSFRQVMVTAEGTFTLPYTLRLGIPPAYTCTFPVPNLTIASVVATESGGNTNGNGYIEPGENSINTSITLSNTGLTNIGPATNISGTVTALTPGVTMNVGASAYPDIVADGSGVNSVPFNFAVGSGVACGAALDFSLTAATAEGTFVKPFQVLTGQPVPNPVVILTDDVEAGAGVWITTTNLPGVGFTITTEQANSPTHSWTDSPGGQYPNGLDTSLISPVYDFTAYDNVTVDFWQRYSTEAGFDYGQVEYSTDGGATWTVAAAYDGVQLTWVNTTLDLSAGLAHKANAQIRFRFVADSGVIDDGWWLDDFTITGQRRVCNPAVLATAGSLSSTQPRGVTTQTLNIQNTGNSELAWAINEVPSLYRPARDAAAVTLPMGGARGDAVSNATALKTPVLLPDPNAPSGLTSLVEGFSDVAGLPAAGWALINNSSPVGLTGWFQGNPAVFQAQAGISNTYVGANFNNTTGANTISNWLLTPELELSNGSTLTFYTRGPAPSPFPDRLQVRLSTAGGSTNVGTTATSVGDFGNLLLDINPTLAVGGYPEAWTAFTVTVSGLPAPTTGRLAFRYFVTDGGPFGANSNYIGIDTVAYNYALPTCPNAGNIPWLSVAPANGTTAAQSTTPVVVTFDSTALGVGTYTGQLCIASNDPFSPLTNVPVTLTVEPAYLAVAHLAPFANTLAGTSVTVTLDGAPALTDVEYGDSTGYLTVAAGPHLVEIYPAGSASPAITGNVVLSPNLSYSAVAIGDGVNQPLGLLALLDDTTPVSGSVKIRIGHVAPFASGPALADVRLQDGTAIITNVPYSLVSPYLTLPAGLYDLKITAPGGSPTLIDPLPVTLNSNDILSVFATGDGVQQKLGVFAWPSNQAGFFLPLMKYLYLPLILR